jgi:transketolase
MAFAASVHAKAADLIKLAIEMTTAADSGHPTSAASLAHLVTVLMYDQMRFDPTRPADPGADRLVLSEGHSCPIIYAAAADLGMTIRFGGATRPMTRQDALTLRDLHSPIDGHPNPAEGFPFFPAATGSLGQGLSISAGLALAARLDGIDRRVYCLIGDGESREGQIWEAVDFMADYRLNEVCPIFNCNTYGQAAHVSHQQSPDVAALKLKAAGFDVRVIDGHDPEAIRAALREHAVYAQNLKDRLFAIVARTVKGWGFQEVMGGQGHGKPVPKKDEARALAAVDAKAKEVGAAWSAGDLQLKAPPSARRPTPSAIMAHTPLSLTDALKKFGQEKALAKGVLAPRKAFGYALRMLGHVNTEVVALDADVGNSTYTEYFADDPVLRQRFFECKIAEQNMISVAGGLASGGKLPFASTFAKFLTRGYDQLEMGLISRFNLKLVGTHTGLGPASDGPSQMSLSDIAFFHAWSTAKQADGKPVMYVLNPADAYCTFALIVAMAQHDGACYLRAMRPDVPLLYNDKTAFTLGGHQVLIEGKDVLIAGSGYLLHEAKKAVESLKAKGVNATLLDLYSLPFDGNAIADLATKNGGRVVTVEDNFGGSFGAAVADALTAHGGSFTLKQMYVSRIPKSARVPEDELQYLGLTADDIVKTAQGLTGGKGR